MPDEERLQDGTTSMKRPNSQEDAFEVGPPAVESEAPPEPMLFEAPAARLAVVHGAQAVGLELVSKKGEALTVIMAGEGLAALMDEVRQFLSDNPKAAASESPLRSRQGERPETAC